MQKQATKPKSLSLFTQIVAILGGALMLIAVVSFGFNWPSGKVHWQSCQPADIKYDSYPDKYCISVIEASLSLKSFMPGQEYEIWIGSGKEVNYGHFIKYEFSDDIDKSKAEWLVDGIEFTDPGQRRLFFPKDLFIGGR